VSGTIALIFASGQNPPISAIDRFLRLIGRGIGIALPLSMSISASSSDRRRQPRATSAAQSVLLPDPGGAGSNSARSSRSTIAAWTIRYWWQYAAIAQLSPHSSSANPWCAGSGWNGGVPSKPNIALGGLKRRAKPRDSCSETRKSANSSAAASSWAA